MKGLCLFIFASTIFLSGCGWLRETRVNHAKSSSTSTEENSVDRNDQLTERRDVQFLQIQKDSSNIWSQVMILPKGKFSLSPANGFEGEADMVYVTRKARENKELLNRGAVQQQTNQKSAVTAKQNKVSTFKKKDKLKYSLPVFRWWMVLIVLPLGWIAWRKIKKAWV